MRLRVKSKQNIYPHRVPIVLLKVYHSTQLSIPNTTMQAQKELEEYLGDSLKNKLFSSSVPPICKSESCVLGIDEAGRGPVLGPMVYAVAYYPQRLEPVLAKMKFADSKQLTEEVRERLFESLQGPQEGFKNLGYSIKILSPNMISNCMLRRYV